MKIVFTGGGTGGHFYPIIAVVQKVNQIIDHDNILGTKLYYISDSPYDKEILFENGLLYEEIRTGKLRRPSWKRQLSKVSRLMNYQNYCGYILEKLQNRLRQFGHGVVYKECRN